MKPQDNEDKQKAESKKGVVSDMREEHTNLEEEFDLEAILAEYKSETPADGQEKTPEVQLDEETKRIVEETLGKENTSRLLHVGGSLAVEEKPEPTPVVEAHIEETQVDLPVESPVWEEVAVSPLKEAEEQVLENFGEAETVAQEFLEDMEDLGTEATQIIPEAIPANGARPRARKRQRHIEPGEVIEIPLSGRFRIEEEKTEDTGEEILKAYAAQEVEAIEPLDESPGFVAGLLGRFSKKKEEDNTHWNDDPKVEEEEGEYDPEDLLEDEITLQRAAGKYGRNVGAYQMRGLGACLIALLMLLFTLLGDGGRNLPGMMGTVQGLTALLLFGLVLVMLITAEVIATGILDLIRLRPGAETLVTLAAFSVVADSLHVINAGMGNRTLPYSAVVSFALGVHLLGFKSVRNAMKLSLRTAAMARNPYIVTSNQTGAQKGFSLMKTKEPTEGFVRKIQQMDFSEYVYQYKAPIAIVCSLLFALLAGMFYAEEMTAAIHYFSAMMVISAGFTGLLIYGLPFGVLAQKLSKIGAALAGWGGATEVRAAKGIIITDSDVFPKGTLSISGVRVFEKARENEIIAYTAAVIVASGCGLSELFADVQEKQKLPVYQAENLSCYEGGGIGATVQGQEVIVGSVNLMNLLGIRLPQNLNVKNAVFVSMAGELAAVFAINYVPLNSVKEALVSLVFSKTKPLFAFRDFNMSPMMMQTKFMIDASKIEFLSYEERYHLSALTSEENARPFAVLSREGLAPLVGITLGGRRLKSAVIWGTVMAVASAVIGFVLLASFFLMDAARTVSSGNLFLYLLTWMVGLYFVSKTVKID